MVLNPEGRARFQTHLQSVMRQPCAVCGTGNWQVEDAIFELREFAGGAVSTQVAVKPLLAMTCNTCGQTLLMSPLKTGIISLNQPAQAEPQPVPESES